MAMLARGRVPGRGRDADPRRRRRGGRGHRRLGRDGRAVRRLSGRRPAQADRRRQARQLRGPARPLRARHPLRGPARRRRAALARRLRRAAATSRGSGYADPPPRLRSPSTSGRWRSPTGRSRRRRRAGVRIAVAIVDHRGDPIQQDCMDGAPTAGPFVAEAVAAAAATFQVAERRGARGVAPLLPIPRRGRARRGADRGGRSRGGRARDRRAPPRTPAHEIAAAVLPREDLRRRLRRDRRPLRGAPRPARRRRGLGVRRLRRARRRDRPRRAAARPAARSSSRASRPARTRARSRRASSASSRPRRRSPRRRSPPPRTCSRTARCAACRTGSAARR